MADSDQPDLRLRPPAFEDAPQIERLVRDSGILDENSGYLYWLLCRDFSGTSIVATRGGGLSGFVTAYRPPDRSDVLFVWQVAVADDAQRRGLALRMLRELIARCGPRGVRYLETTVTERNTPSQRLFRALARELEAPLEKATGFRVSGSQNAEREEEPLIRIGPFKCVSRVS